MATALGCLGVFIAVGAYFVFAYAKRHQLSLKDRLIAVWYFVDACTHLIFEHSFILLSLHGPSAWPASHFISSWREYGRADRRWAFVFDDCIVSLELLTVYLVGPLCVVALYALITRQRYYHFVQIVLCVCELYGGWMTFVPEFLGTQSNLDTSSALYLWVYLVFANAVWVLIPGYLLYDSYNVLDESLSSKNDAPAVGRSPRKSSAGRSKSPRPQ